MVIDKEAVTTASFNFTKVAEKKNAENLLILRSKVIAKTFIVNGEKHKGRSEKYEGR